MVHGQLEHARLSFVGTPRSVLAHAAVSANPGGALTRALSLPASSARVSHHMLPLPCR